MDVPYLRIIPAFSIELDVTFRHIDISLIIKTMIILIPIHLKVSTEHYYY